MTDAVEREEEMVLERLMAIRELRQATHELEGRDGGARASSIMLPASWLDFLDRGLAKAAEDAEEDHDEGKLDDDDYRKRVERADRLTKAIRDVQPGSACAIDLTYREALLEGLRNELRFHDFETERLSEYDPLGPRLIAWHTVDALYQLIEVLDPSVDSDVEPGQD